MQMERMSLKDKRKHRSFFQYLDFLDFLANVFEDKRPIDSELLVQEQHIPQERVCLKMITEYNLL